MNRAKAVIYIPPDLADDSQFARDCLAYAARRRYRFFAILRTWAEVEVAMSNGADTVIVARAEHVTDGAWQGWDIELVGESTVDLAPRLRPAVPPPSPRGAATSEPESTADQIATWNTVGGLLVATAGAFLLWVGLRHSHWHVAAEGPLYALVIAITALWVPLIGAGLERAWLFDIRQAHKAGQVEGHREGYEDGFVDCLTLRNS